MTEFQAFILGLIQGLTEFLPISSTGHLYLGRHLFHLDEAGLFLDTMLHIGTLIALIAVYKDELFKLIIKPFSRTTLLLAAGTVPAAAAGVLFSSWFEKISQTGVTIGWEFLATGFILWFADKAAAGRKSLEHVTVTDALIIGSFQAAAIMPALSRSGLTIAAGLFRKLDRETAAWFSFLLSIPAIAGGIVFQLKSILTGAAEPLPLSSMLIATLSSAFFGYLAVVWMINILKKKSLKGFSYYVWALGLLILILQFTGIF